MKFKTSIAGIAFIVILIAQALTSVTFADEQDREDPNKTGTQWLKNHYAGHKLVFTGIEGEVSGELNEIGYFIKLGFTSKWESVNCCKFRKDEYSYCDAMKQHHLC